MSEVFPITPASGNIFWVLGPVGVLLIGLLAMFGYISYSATHVRFEVSPEGLRIRGISTGDSFRRHRWFPQKPRKSICGAMRRIAQRCEPMARACPGTKPDGSGWPTGRRRSCLSPTLRAWSTFRRAMATRCC